jgi:hypothetical protein
MFSDDIHRPRLPHREWVIALQRSGFGAGQLREPGETLGAGYELVAPEHYGCEGDGPWTGTHAFTLADEAARTVALIDAADRKVQLAIPTAVALPCIRPSCGRPGAEGHGCCANPLAV